MDHGSVKYEKAYIEIVNGYRDGHNAEPIVKVGENLFVMHNFQ